LALKSGADMRENVLTIEEAESQIANENPADGRGDARNGLDLREKTGASPLFEYD
jgi:hypothetical protein